MDIRTQLQLGDYSVSVDQFTTELATKIAFKMLQINRGELEISQSQAFKMFGKADVLRWVKNGKLSPCRISPGKKRYKLVELQRLADIQQNYTI